MKAKSLALQIIGFVTMMLTGIIPNVKASVAELLGVFLFGLTLIVHSFAPTGEFPKGWTSVMWTVNIAAVVIQILQYSSEHIGLDPMIVNYATLSINAFLFSFIKDYGSGTIIGRAS